MIRVHTEVRSTRTQLIADAQRRGVVALQCECCGYKRSIQRLGLGCNAADPSIDGGTCEGWNLREVMAVSA